MATCSCPLPAAIPDIGTFDCPVNFGQIVKIAFQRIDDANNIFDDAASPAPNPITAKASWDAFIAAADNTKMQVSPIFSNFSIPAGEAITEGGGDNSTVDGAVLTVGAGSISASGEFRMLPGSIKTDLDALSCEGKLGVYFINGDGAVIARKISGTTAGTDMKYGPLPISNFFISDRDHQGYATQDKFNFSFLLQPGWSDDAEIVVPGFNARNTL